MEDILLDIVNEKESPVGIINVARYVEQIIG
jgi:hypothetical protein